MLILVATLLLAPAITGGPDEVPPPPPAQAAEAPEVPAAPRAPRAPRALPPPPVTPAPPALPAPVVAGGELAVLRGDWPATPSGLRITIAEHGTVDDTVEQIAEKAGWNAVLNTGRVGDRMLVLKLKEVPVEEALRAALSGTGLVATRRGNVVAVSPAIGPIGERPILSGFDKPSGKRITVDLQDMDGRDALLEIGKAGGLSIVLPHGTLGKVTAHFRDAPVEEALKAVLSQAGLAASREGSIVTVTSREPGLGARFEFKGELGPEIGRTVEAAMRQAQRDLRQAQRDMNEEASTDAPRPRNVEHVGSDVVIESGQHARDVVAVKGNATLRSGAEAREVVAVLGSVTLEAGASARQVVAIGGDVRIGPGASVERDAISIGGRVQVDPSADVGGQRTAVPFPFTGSLSHLLRGVDDGESGFAWTVAKGLAKFAVYLALGLLLLVLVPRRVEVVGTALVANPWKSLITGFLGLLAQPFLALLLVVTILGIPLVAVQVIGVALAGVLGFTALAWHLGRSLPTPVQRGTMVVQLAVGMAILVLLTQIPFLGWLIWTTLLMLTFGAVLRTRFGQPPPGAPIMPTTPVDPIGPSPAQVA